MNQTDQRLVKACPLCGCSELYMQTRSRHYRCNKCKNVFPKSSVTLRPGKPHGYGASPRMVCEARKNRIREYHEANPCAGKYQIMAALNETYTMVTKYMESLPQAEVSA
ncbi:hypothetical protein [uncultured Methanomethylovorans sp.]|uniref:hypothetical protein n=1 Tax=uncultured Methanomethylovorans sp. TaxID=183759 RepID=UPI002AA77BB8|nr:hypothetical protein [uncultured Methanomethylovorans sp.]